MFSSMSFRQYLVIFHPAGEVQKSKEYITSWIGNQRVPIADNRP